MQQANYDVINSFEKDNWWYRAKRDLFTLLLGKVGKKFDKALDVGCGVGSNFEVLNKFSGKVFGVDYSSRAITYCRKKPYSSLKQMDATQMTFSDDSFDLIICSDVLEHLNDISAVKEITRVLKPGGMLIFSVPAHNYLWGPTDIISNHRKRYKKSDLVALFGQRYIIKKIAYWNIFMYLPDLLFVALMKLVKRNKQEKNALEFVPPFLNNILYLLIRLENRWFIRFNNPQGVSIVGVAQKK